MFIYKVQHLPKCKLQSAQPIQLHACLYAIFIGPIYVTRTLKNLRHYYNCSWQFTLGRVRNLRHLHSMTGRQSQETTYPKLHNYRLNGIFYSCSHVMIFLFYNTAVVVISGVTYIGLKSVIRCRDSFEVVSHMFDVVTHTVDVVTHGFDVVTLAVDVVTHAVDVVTHRVDVVTLAVDVVTHRVDVVTLAVDVVTHTVGTYSAIATQ